MVISREVLCLKWITFNEKHQQRNKLQKPMAEEIQNSSPFYLNESGCLEIKHGIWKLNRDHVGYVFAY